MPEWPAVTLASVCGKPMYGLIASATDQPVGPPFVRQTDIVTGEIDWTTVPFCVASAEKLEKYALSEGDLLISRLGAGVGTAARAREPHGAVFAGYLVRFRADPEVLDHRFAGYVLHSDGWLQHVERVRSGAAQPTLNAQQMGQFQFRLPPLQEQRRIAGVLGALDDLIDSNRRLQATLAHQRFATMAHAVSSESDSTTFGEIAELARVQVSPAGVAPGTPYLGLEHFARNASGLLGVGVADGLDSTKWRFEAGDVLYGKLRPYFQKVVRPNFDGVCSTEIWVLRPKEGVSSEYLEWVASTQEFTNFATAGSSGTRMPRADWDHVRTFVVIKSAGDAFIRPIAASRVMWEQYWALHEENEELGRTRDELLPALLLGQVLIEDVAA